MKILVVYGSDEIMQRVRYIFSRLLSRYDFDIHSSVNNIEGAETSDIVFSIHAKIIFPARLVRNVRCINIHPGFNPYNRGMFPHVWSIINELPVGVTIHEMDDQIDHGPILVREQMWISNKDTSETLYNKILLLEERLLSENVDAIINNTLKAYPPEHEGNYNSLKDYKNLCNLDLDGQSKTFKEWYNLLRALSHGDYKNAKYKGKYLKLNIYDS